ncbi:ACP S-malonyltransferase [Mesoaciditoga lauensis]|uniref:ACP S-malonyltransferase n=1 Tax=Mesoaciditoga lauensis TaxID=1495039 RepID=UPI00055F93E2|nr:ACP S-malonyltransferase [Mesoaciditoga lauensis]
MKIALVFPGQGSQKLNMMKDYYEEFKVARDIMDKACKVLDFDLKSLIFGEDEMELTRTYNAQPALLTTSMMVFEILKSRISFDVVAGHSLGEYSALVAAGVLSFKDALKAVRLRGMLMENAIPSGAGSMLAIVGLPFEKVEEIVQEIDGIYIANYNSEKQVVISGEITSLLSSEERFQEAGARRVVHLNVSGPFHSPLMEPAKKEFEKFLNSLEFHSPKVPIVLNVTGKPAKTSTEIREKLIEQLTSPVRWVKSIWSMEEMGITDYIEVGSGRVLSGLIKRTTKAFIHSTNTVEELEKTLEGVMKNARIAEF